MGYRSEVAFEIFGSYKQLEDFQGKCPDLVTMNEKNNEIVLIHEDISNTPNIYRWLFYNSCIKWFDEYPNVEQFNKIWAEVKKLNLEGRFVCLGEDDSDNEMMVVGPYNYGQIGWTRQITGLSEND